MTGLRPKPSIRYLVRPRLLRRLPDDPGYVVWLQAPYGYGKSVLASQWADRLEAEAWRVIWIALARRKLRPALAQALALPPNTPWDVLTEALWHAPTLVVLEDLHKNAPVGPLLRTLGGLLLLASRQELTHPELPRLDSTGRLVHLKAADLAFTLEEAEALFPTPQAAHAAWRQCRGWPLPLHLAALHGRIPEREALLEGARQSLSPEAWAEGLLLAAVPYLPHGAATPATRALVEAGFAQELMGGYRLHPLIATTLRKVYPKAVRQAVRAAVRRLPPLTHGEALAGAGMLEELAAFLEEDYAPAGHEPEAVLRWDALAPGPRGPTRLLGLGWALSATGANARAVQALLQAARHPSATADQIVTALGWAITCLPPTPSPEAHAFIAEGERWVEQASPERAAAFFTNVGEYYLAAAEPARAEAFLQQAAQRMPPGHYNRAVLQNTLAEAQWERWGDLEGYIARVEDSLTVMQAHVPYNLPANHRNLGVFKALLGQRTEALQHFDEAVRWAKQNRILALVAQAEKAALLEALEPLPELAARCTAWRHPWAQDRTHALWAQVLRKAKDPEAALRVLEGQDGPFAQAERALVLLDLNQPDAALACADRSLAGCRTREQRLAAQAARYRVTRAPQDLQDLLELTLARERVLPGLVPLESLPQDRPTLARAYPLEAVLRSGWKDAVRLRHAEIPPLELEVLGGVRARTLGASLPLTTRQREILTLLTLRQSREAIGAALWPEADAEKVRNNLHVQLNLLRKTLEPWGVPTFLTPEGLARTRCDLWDLERALEARDAEAVLGLYRGPLAPEVDLPLVNEARAHLVEQVNAALFAASSAAPPLRAEAMLLRVLELDPLHEEALKRLLWLLVRRGRKREAWRRYRAFAERLWTELGVEPSPETRNLLA
ncbi:BTAD domain-containing putative transcriptional regulator [Marinithermus hydrothermalis]|uniref:Response regulator receiver and SARP domain protein n=1 Tax=Marinithermus hydrothermalis (strain DSM 14884 / JCM 11576 / T1) TaxID=869210 RepID=F2NPB9_MARHT|nr:BTAD domain-containing putative transcriptional regulator [Marinithermus hydrothermalis]AEB12200.1 response regulator receiver and SARP domain protein [Marinithermus hydrothermalis DSM 14884]